MKNNILEHLELKILSLVIAIIVWVIVANVDDYKATKQVTGIEIEFVNGNAITGKNKVYEVPDGTTIDVVVKGRRKVVEGLTREDFRAVADLSKMSITNAVKVEVSAVRSQVARDLTISYVDDSVVVAVEDKVKKQLPVTVRTLSDVAAGYAIRSKTAAPNLLTVEGAESAVNLIEEVVVDVNVAGARQNLTATSRPVFLDKSGTVIDSSRFSYDSNEIEVNVEVMKTKEIDVKVQTTGTPQTGYEVSDINFQPTSVVVVGDSAKLSEISEVVIDDVDVSGCSADLETSVSVADYLPEGVTLAGEAQEIMIKVMVDQVDEKVLLISLENISVTGKQDGYSYQFNGDGKYSLRLRGRKDILDKLTVSDLAPTIDVSGYRIGAFSVSVQFKTQEDIEFLNTVKASIVITANGKLQ